MQSGESIYPYNNVTRSRSGHLFEIDDTLGAERIHRQHKCGTYETLDATGGRVLHIIGDGWEIIAGNNNITVGGNNTVTIVGDCQTVIQGNYNLRVQGDYNLTVDGKVRNNIGGGISTDVTGDVGLNTSGNLISIVHGSSDIKSLGGENVTIGKDSKRLISGNSQTIINGSAANIVNGDSVISAGGSFTLAGGTSVEVGSGGEANIDCPSGLNVSSGDLYVQKDVNVDGASTVKGLITSNDDVLAQSVSLGTHVHRGVQSGNNTTLPPNP